MIIPEQNHWNLYVMQIFPPVLGFLKAYCILYPNVYLTIVFNNIDIFLFLKTVLQTEQHTRNGFGKQEFPFKTIT